MPNGNQRKGCWRSRLLDADGVLMLRTVLDEQGRAGGAELKLEPAPPPPTVGKVLARYLTRYLASRVPLAA